jgi:hypothetical protein
MTGMRIGAKTVITWSDLQTVFDVLWEPQSLRIESDACAAAQDYWLLGELHHG